VGEGEEGRGRGGSHRSASLEGIFEVIDEDVDVNEDEDEEECYEEELTPLFPSKPPPQKDKKLKRVNTSPMTSSSVHSPYSTSSSSSLLHPHHHHRRRKRIVDKGIR